MDDKLQPIVVQKLALQLSRLSSFVGLFRVRHRADQTSTLHTIAGFVVAQSTFFD
jgi:hypothetical protein